MLLACATLLSHDVFAAENRSSTIALSDRAPFVSPGHFVWDHALAPIGARMERLLVERSLDLPRRSRVTRSHRPLRQITFVGGDCISAEVLDWRDDLLVLRVAGGHVAAVPNSSVEAISVPSGEAEWIAESFETETPLSGHVDEQARSQWNIDTNVAASGHCSLRLVSGLQPLSVAIAATAKSARVQFWFRTERSVSVVSGGRMSFDLVNPVDASNATHTLALQLVGTRLAVVERPHFPARWTTQTVELAQGWHCLTAVTSPHQVLCFVDESLLAASTESGASFRSIRLAASDGFWIDDLLVSHRIDERSAVSGRSLDEDDVVVTQSGDEYFGHLDRLDQHAVGVTGGAGAMTLPWSRIAAVRFRRAEQPVREIPESLIGVVARIDWQSFVDRPELDADRLTVTITAITRETLLVAHPWLGEFLIPWRDVRRIEPLFVGRSQLLEARCIHLGESLRADFGRPLPDGTTWHCEFDLKTEPLNNVWFSLDVADLEPSGPETPPGSPFLNPLRAGWLVTEVFVNGQSVGDLNRLARFKASRGKPDRLRCPLPRDALRFGTNTLELRQRPLTERGSDYDDCEVANLRLEVGTSHFK